MKDVQRHLPTPYWSQMEGLLPPLFDQNDVPGGNRGIRAAVGLR